MVTNGELMDMIIVSTVPPNRHVALLTDLTVEVRDYPRRQKPAERELVRV